MIYYVIAHSTQNNIRLFQTYGKTEIQAVENLQEKIQEKDIELQTGLEFFKRKRTDNTIHFSHGIMKMSTTIHIGKPETFYVGEL